MMCGKTSEYFLPASIWAVAIACIMVIFFVRITGIINTYSTVSFVDDVIYVDPAVNLAKKGVLAAPGISQQLSEKGIIGIDTSYHITTPLNWAFRAPFVAILPNIPQAKATADLAIFLLLVVSFFILSRTLSSTAVALYFSGLFVTYKIVGFAAPGRPDLLSATFGLCALACVLKGAKSVASAKWLLISGVLCGLSLLAHQFGGVVWTLTCLATLSAARSTPSIIVRVRELILVVIGVIFPCLAYMVFVLQDYENWRSQFFWLVELKRTLSKSVELALVDTAKQSILRNPIAFVVVIASLIIMFFGRDMVRKKIAIALISIFLCSIAWRVLSFEHYNSHYNVHFAALICFLGSLSLPSLIRFNEVKSRAANFLLWTGLISALIVGLFACINPITSTLLLPHKLAYDNRQSVIEKIPKNASLLVGCDIYFEVDHPIKTAMAHHEDMDLQSFKYILTTIAPVPAAEHRDQWFDTLTKIQESTMASSFELVRVVPSKQLNFKIPLTPVQPQMLGLYLWRQKGSLENYQ